VAAAFVLVLASHANLALCRRLARRADGTPAPWRPLRSVLAWISGALLVGGGVGLATWELLGRATVLTEQRRWRLDTRLHDPRGMACLDGRVYLADYGERLPSGDTKPGFVGVFDPEKAELSRLELTGPEGPVPWANPGDVKLGPDGLLYVLNNGPGALALLGFGPDGRVVRRLALRANTRASKGLGFGRDGALYVSDMVGGNVHRYSPEGGLPFATWRGAFDGMNNPQVLFVDRDERLYLSEGFPRVQVLDGRSGSSLHTFDIACSPRSFASEGGDSPWLEVICQDGLWSLDTARRRVRRVRVEGEPPGWRSVSAYERPGRLYMLDGESLVAYRVER
jgi:hypothetical protein